MNTLLLFVLSLAASNAVFEGGGEVPIATDSALEAPDAQPPLAEHPTLQDLLRQTNELRTGRGLAPLRLDARLVEAAQDHAFYMARTGDFGHDGNGGHVARALRHGYHEGVGECVAHGIRSVAGVLGIEGNGGWLNSPSNRAHLLSDQIVDVGFGYALSDEGHPYWVAVFGVSRDESVPPATDEAEERQPGDDAAASPVADKAPAERPTAVYQPVRLMSAAKEAQLRRLLPRVSDSNVQRMLDDPHLILYTEAEMPKAYQFWDGQFPGVHLASYNISANGSEPFGNGNREFPWSGPAGTHRAKSVNSFRFLWLPRDDEGRPRPVTWYRKRLSGDRSLGYAWIFPVGTILGEVLTLKGPGGDYTFELRIRQREKDDWGVDVFRPFPTAADLAERIKQLRPDWQEQEHLVRFVEYLEADLELPSHTLADRQPLARTFMQTMGIDTLPPLEDAALVRELLTSTTFQSALGATWRFGSNGTRTAAPTTHADFHIVPASYDAGFVDVDRISCLRCHETVNQNVNRFDRSRDWYGRIRGSDGIFSFHPFSLDSISGNGFQRPVRMRDELQTAGLLEKFDPARHSPEHYSQIPHLHE